MANLRSTLHHLTVAPGRTLEQYESEAGALWRKSLLWTTERNGWEQTAWGRHHENRDQVIVWIEWKTAEEAQAFLANDFSHWVGMISSLTTGKIESHVVDLGMCDPIPAWHPGIGPTTFYKFLFSAPVSPQERSSLVAEFSDHMSSLACSNDLAVSHGLIRWDNSWTDDPATGQDCSVLYVTVIWESFEAMQRITAIDEEENRSLERYLEPVIGSCDVGWQYFNVEWDVLHGDLLEDWKASPYRYDPMKKNEK